MAGIVPTFSYVASHTTLAGDAGEASVLSIVELVQFSFDFENGEEQWRSYIHFSGRAKTGQVNKYH